MNQLQDFVDGTRPEHGLNNEPFQGAGLVKLFTGNALLCCECKYGWFNMRSEI
jgi:hypothetical protein